MKTFNIIHRHRGYCIDTYLIPVDGPIIRVAVSAAVPPTARTVVQAGPSARLPAARGMTRHYPPAAPVSP